MKEIVAEYEKNVRGETAGTRIGRAIPIEGTNLFYVDRKSEPWPHLDIVKKVGKKFEFVASTKSLEKIGDNAWKLTSEDYYGKQSFSIMNASGTVMGGFESTYQQFENVTKEQMSETISYKSHYSYGRYGNADMFKANYSEHETQIQELEEEMFLGHQPFSKQKYLTFKSGDKNYIVNPSTGEVSNFPSDLDLAGETEGSYEKRTYHRRAELKPTAVLPNGSVIVKDPNYDKNDIESLTEQDGIKSKGSAKFNSKYFVFDKDGKLLQESAYEIKPLFSGYAVMGDHEFAYYPLIGTDKVCKFQTTNTVPVVEERNGYARVSRVEVTSDDGRKVRHDVMVTPYGAIKVIEDQSKSFQLNEEEQMLANAGKEFYDYQRGVTNNFSDKAKELIPTSVQIAETERRAKSSLQGLVDSVGSTAKNADEVHAGLDAKGFFRTLKHKVAALCSSIKARFTKYNVKENKAMERTLDELNNELDSMTQSNGREV